MLFVLTALDKADAGERRLALRPAHLDYIRDSGMVRLAGPYLDEAGNMVGSLIILEAADLEAAEAWARAEPYAEAGLFQSSQIRPWKAAVNFCGADL